VGDRNISSYLCTFDRIGRHHKVPALVADAASAVDLADKIFQHVRPQLYSDVVTVSVDLEEMTGRITVGLVRPAGQIEITNIARGRARGGMAVVGDVG